LCGFDKNLLFTVRTGIQLKIYNSMNVSSIISSSVNPGMNQVVQTTQSVIPSSQDIQKFSSTRSKDMYAGSVTLDITYSDLARNNIKPRTSDITLSSSAVLPQTSSAISGSKDYVPTASDLAPSASTIRPRSRDITPSQADVARSGDLRTQIVKSISEQVQKNIEKLSRYNLSKGNRLLKTITFNEA
jgi:hypothetical protein